MREELRILIRIGFWQVMGSLRLVVKFKDSRGAEQEDSVSVQVCPEREEAMTPNKRGLRDRTNTSIFPGGETVMMT